MKRLFIFLLCVSLCLGSAGAVDAEETNPNEYTLTVERNAAADGSGTYGYNVFLTQTVGEDPMGLLSAQIVCPASGAEGQAAGGSGAKVKYSSGLLRITLDALAENFALTRGIKTLIASFSVTSDVPPELSYTPEGNGGYTNISNAGYRGAAKLSVEISNRVFVTAAPELTSAYAVVAGGEGKTAVFPLKAAPEDTEYRLYAQAAGGTPLTRPVLSKNGSALMLTFDSVPSEAVGYYIAAVSNGMEESGRVPVSVCVYTPAQGAGQGSVSAVFPRGVLPAGTTATLIEAWYNGGKMVGVNIREGFDPEEACTAQIPEGADRYSLLLLSEEYAPVCEGFTWTRP